MPHPAARYCKAIPMVLDTTQYNARPLGNPMVIMPNITGIIHCIIRFICICFGSVDTVAIIFCCTHIEPPTSKGSMTLVGSGSERSNQRKPLFRGIAVWTPGSQEYSFCERSTRRSGFRGMAWMID